MLLVFAALAVALVVAVALLRRRRSAARAPGISLTPHAPRAGVSHLASQVSELSDLGLHLRAGPPQRRLGTLLGSGHAATR
jgi:hypothetical protein